jgi:hypothetical protein
MLYHFPHRDDIVGDGIRNSGEGIRGEDPDTGLRGQRRSPYGRQLQPLNLPSVAADFGEEFAVAGTNFQDMKRGMSGIIASQETPKEADADASALATWVFAPSAPMFLKIDLVGIETPKDIG